MQTIVIIKAKTSNQYLPEEKLLYKLPKCEKNINKQSAIYYFPENSPIKVFDDVKWFLCDIYKNCKYFRAMTWGMLDLPSSNQMAGAQRIWQNN